MQLAKNFEVYVAGREFELVTDRQALTYLSKSKNHNKHLMSEMVNIFTRFLISSHL